MENTLEDKLQEIYKNCQVEVKFIDYNLYDILITIELNNKIYYDYVQYKYDNKKTLDVNLEEINKLLDKLIIMYVKGENENV